MDAIDALMAVQPINVLTRGLTNDNTDCQSAADALMADPTALVLRFPPGIYRCYLNNTVSGRTLIFDEGAIIDGTIHIAIGRGPDTNPGETEITWTDNTRVIGTATSTVRVGTFYCRKTNIDKIRITEIDPAYVNQTAEGGSNGVHLYVGTKDLTCGEIICDSATDGAYALSIDAATTIDADHKPENISIDNVIVRNNTQSILTTKSTKNVRIGNLIADSWDYYIGVSLVEDENLRIDRAILSGAPTVTQDGIYVLNGISASFGEIEISGAKQIGFRTFNCGRVDADSIRVDGSGLDQVRIESPGNIGRIETSDAGTGAAVLIQGNANGLTIGEIYNDGGGSVRVLSDDVTVPIITSKNNASGYGLELSGADRFTNQYLLTDGNSQGLRMVTVTDPTFGALYIRNNTTGIAISTVSGVSYDNVAYSGNTSDGTALNTLPGFRGSRIRSGAATLGNADATLIVGNNPPTQVCATSLTADRTVTVSTTGAKNGDRFRIARTAASGGAFNLIVAGVTGGPFNLATGQWLEVEYVSGWQMTAKGTL
ncbi:hypothetical protein [Stakelama pacifica]|uniref:hypothetical protein n=1 Tax=Stakelama pacifica TaxID=517720 RepID=UPI001B85DF6F|nr:hypothetical protein [Stakelama pacifica]